ncbi:hypothetical protein H257_13659 [Aphanomyces astaci]|uniref:Uncharacterized protein n=1 Tax=Aphanomyces astaci TaxID=112090 RepID=W4FTQ5_APHAT|nr:hypothetical protein H257_13659 [Aphanomyces astaci]ETV70895.1 hypothetical protein H257_13659 [Aphanomyces astaci]|eukprot:XP_009839558.1 hypothetical protein H257_13659 [Aphanomyces astaci]
MRGLDSCLSIRCGDKLWFSRGDEQRDGGDVGACKRSLVLPSSGLTSHCCNSIVAVEDWLAGSRHSCRPCCTCPEDALSISGICGATCAGAGLLVGRRGGGGTLSEEAIGTDMTVIDDVDGERSGRGRRRTVTRSRSFEFVPRVVGARYCGVEFADCLVILDNTMRSICVSRICSIQSCVCLVIVNSAGTFNAC